jgi:RNA polymerase sigma-70 factor (ECF subfamily)
MTWSEKIRDRESFTALYRTHHPVVFRFALSMSGDRTVAADVTQDVFVWLIHHPDSFDPARGELSSFLIGVARKFLLRHTQNDRRLVPLDEGTHTVLELPDDEQNAVEALRAAVAALPARVGVVIVL